MSRATKRKRAVQRAAQQGRVIPQHELMAALAQLMHGKNNEALFSPGQPMEPQKGANPDGRPITWMYPIGYNTYAADRPQGNIDIPSFEQLRRLAKLYSGITLCLRVILDLVPNLQLKIELSEEMTAAGYEAKDFPDEIAAHKQFFSRPFGADDPRNMTTWLRIALKEQYVVDELYLYKKRTNGGKLYGLPIVAGDTMKPLLDQWGTVVGYKQFPRGLPGENFGFDQMIRFNESPSADSVFGFSRVENIMTEVNQALRKKRVDLARYTDGNIPAGIMEVPEGAGWSSDKIEAYEMMWNALIAGNAQQQARIKFTQPGMKYVPFHQYADTGHQTEFDQFLLNIAAASFGLSMQDLGFTGDIHKSSGDSQQNVLGRRVLYPIANQYAAIFTDILHNDFNDRRFIVKIGGFEESEDVATLAGTYSTLTGAGILGLSSAAKLLHLPEEPDAPHIGRVFMTKDGPVFLDDVASDEMRQAAMKARIAGYAMAANPPEEGQQNAQQEANQQDNENGDEQPEGKNAQTSRATASALREADLAAEYRRWRTRAIDDIRAARPIRTFSSAIISERQNNSILAALNQCKSVNDAKEVFRVAQEGTSE